MKAIDVLQMISQCDRTKPLPVDVADAIMETLRKYDELGDGGPAFPTTPLWESTNGRIGSDGCYVVEDSAGNAVCSMSLRGSGMNHVTAKANSQFIAQAPLIVREAIIVLKDLRRGDCWCEKAVGNPMVKGHREACKKATQLLELLESLVTP